MRKIKTLALVIGLILVISIPIIILGDSLNFKTDEEREGNVIAPKDPFIANGIKDVNIAKEMQDAIDALDFEGIDISELKNLKTEYASFSNEERLAMLEEDYENIMRYQKEKERIILSFSEILKEEGFQSLNIHEFTKDHKYL